MFVPKNLKLIFFLFCWICLFGFFYLIFSFRHFFFFDFVQFPDGSRRISNFLKCVRWIVEWNGNRFCYGVSDQNLGELAWNYMYVDVRITIVVYDWWKKVNQNISCIPFVVVVVVVVVLIRIHYYLAWSLSCSQQWRLGTLEMVYWATYKKNLI